jgi:transcriptional regulator of nitric oxide reductase
MQLGRSQVSTLRPLPILSVEFNQDGRLFTVASETGYEVWRTWPLQLVRRRGQSRLYEASSRFDVQYFLVPLLEL